MSQSRPDLPNDSNSARAYIEKLLLSPHVQAVYVKGSRSPMTEKEPKKTSDWDLEVVATEGFIVANPRLTGELHACVHVVQEISPISVDWKEVLNG